MLKSIIKTLIPKFLFKSLQPIYHGAMALIASIYYGNPSAKLTVIGVTGTAGKSTTVIMTAQILSQSGKKSGYITTAGSSNGNSSGKNMHGLSMPGGWMLQRQLSEMVKNNCQYAIVECTSEGLAQNRHLGIHFHGAMFTNLSPAHIDAHGSFENYRKAKGRLFATVKNKNNSFIGSNLDDPNKNYFIGFPAVRKFGVSMRADLSKPEDMKTFFADDVVVTDHISFKVQGVGFNLHMFGTFNVTNALLAIGCANFEGVSLQEASAALNKINTVPGRMEVIAAPNGATIVIDYAPEPAAMEASLRAVRMMPHEKLIHVFGSTGGHRDVSKRFTFGEISGQLADTIIITNDDVYDSNPNEIAQNISEGINRIEPDKKNVKTVRTILDRRAAIADALQTAEPKDVVLITGKGSEQFLVLPNNNRVAWDERQVVTELLNQTK